MLTYALKKINREIRNRILSRLTEDSASPGSRPLLREVPRREGTGGCDGRLELRVFNRPAFRTDNR